METGERKKGSREDDERWNPHTEEEEKEAACIIGYCPRRGKKKERRNGEREKESEEMKKWALFAEVCVEAIKRPRVKRGKFPLSLLIFLSAVGESCCHQL